MKEREQLGTRLGFLLLAAGSAIGLGNVWRFPFIAGRYGGAAFVLVYLVFLLILGMPVMIMELAAGRASRRNLVGAFKVLPQNKKIPWHIPSYVFFSGNAFLMFFYTTITGWLMNYACRFLVLGTKVSTAEESGKMFGSMLDSPAQNMLGMAVAVVAGSVVCGIGLRKGVEKVTKFLMAGLFLLLFLLSIYSCFLPGAAEGLSFYLKPDFSHLSVEAVCAAMSQAFFSLSLGVGSILICGSYTDNTNTMAKESLVIIGMDTLAAFMAGFIIFPSCMTCGVEANSGPSLVFVTLPAVFGQMSFGRLWGGLFFLFMSIAALTTVIAVFEHLIAFFCDEVHVARKISTLITGIGVFICSIPCALGFNLWKCVEPLGKGTGFLDLEDYIVSDNLLPLGAIYLTLFCCLKCGWGWKNYLAEANTGKGLKVANCLEVYCKYFLPLLIFALFAITFYSRWLAK